MRREESTLLPTFPAAAEASACGAEQAAASGRKEVEGLAGTLHAEGRQPRGQGARAGLSRPSIHSAHTQRVRGFDGNGLLTYLLRSVPPLLPHDCTHTRIRKKKKTNSLNCAFTQLTHSGSAHPVVGMLLHLLQTLRRRPAMTPQGSVLLKIPEGLDAQVCRAEIRIYLGRVQVGVGTWIGDWKGSHVG